MLDFAVCSPDLRALVEVEPDFETPWSPHIGLVIKLRAEPGADMVTFPRPIKEIRPGIGPHRWSWAQCLEEAGTTVKKQETPHGYTEAATTDQIDMDYAVFSRAVELYKVGGSEDIDPADDYKKYLGRWGQQTNDHDRGGASK